MPLLISHSLNPKDEPILQQLEIHLQSLSQDKKAAIAIAALYEATEPDEIYFDYICDCCSKFNKAKPCVRACAIALLQDLSKPGLLAVAIAITEELAVLEQLQGANR
jgi:hypothetical protein